MNTEHRSISQPPSDAGFALVGAMVILMVVTILALSVSKTTSLNHLIAINDKVAKVDLYDQDRCSTQGQIDFRDWMTDDFLNEDEDKAYFPHAGVDDNGNGDNDDIDATCTDLNGITVAEYKVRKVYEVESSDLPIDTWQDINDYDTNDDGDISKEEAENHPANSFPVMAHIDKPDPGSGYDPKNFEIRRFLITSYSRDSNHRVVVQKGAYKVFNNY